MKEAIANRPTETLTGVVLAGTIFGFLAQSGVPNVVAAIIAVAIAFAPAAVSTVVDEIRSPR